MMNAPFKDGKLDKGQNQLPNEIGIIQLRGYNAFYEVKKFKLFVLVL